MNKPSIWFWVLGVLFLIWNAIGCYMYILDRTLSDPAYAEMYGEAMLAIRDQYPAWSMSAYAIAVWGGLLGAIMMLLRRRWAVILFIISLIAAVISFIWGLTNAEARAAAGSTAWVMPVLVFGLGVLEIWYSRRQKAKAILK